MQVLSVNKFFWEKGGSEAVFFAEKELLENAGHSVVPFSMRSAQNEESEFEKFFIDEVDYSDPKLKTRINSALKIIYSFEARRNMSDLLLNVSPDVAHFHIFQHQISPSVFSPLKKKNIPLVLTLHDLKPICPNYKMYTNGRICEECKGNHFYNCFLNKCTKGSRFKSLINMFEMYAHHFLGYYSQVDHYIAVSNFYRKKMIEYGFDENKVTHVPNFIDSDKFLFRENDQGYALYFGRLSEEKGVELLLSAANLTPKIPIVIAGTGPAQESLQKMALEMGLKNVSFVGFKSGRDLHSLISNASFTVLPSRWYENCPMSVLESFALGTPVLGSNIGGIPELITEGEDGLVFEPDSHEDLAQKMEIMWHSLARRYEMARFGRHKVETEYSAEKHYELLMCVYNKVL